MKQELLRLQEEIYQTTDVTFEQARIALFQYIEGITYPSRRLDILH